MGPGFLPGLFICAWLVGSAQNPSKDFAKSLLRDLVQRPALSQFSLMTRGKVDRGAMGG